MGARDLVIREATTADAEAICRIYNQGIEDRVATLETTLRTRAERAEWLAAREARHPVLVALSAATGAVARVPTAAAPADGDVLGWASLNRFNPRPAYDHVADVSVYVERQARGRGVGHALLEALMARARALGYHKLVLAAFPENKPGMALYRRLGFSEVGVYREQGLLDRRWVDVIVMERLL